MKIVNIHEAKTHLSWLAEEVAGGEEIIVAKAGRPMMKLVPIAKKTKKRKIGVLKGKIHIAKDFDAPLPDKLLDAFDRMLAAQSILEPLRLVTSDPQVARYRSTVIKV